MERAIEDLREVYQRLKDPEMDEELHATVKLAGVIAQMDGRDKAVEWLQRQAQLVEEIVESGDNG